MTASRVSLFIALLAVAAFVPALVMDLWSPWSRVSMQVLPSIAFALIFAVISFACAVAMERGRAVRLMSVGIITAIIALTVFQLWVWAEGLGLDFLWPKLVVWPTACCAFAAVTGLLLLPPINDTFWRIVRGISIFLLACFAISICLTVFLYPDWWLGEYVWGHYYSTSYGSYVSYKYSEHMSRFCAAVGSVAIGSVMVTFLGVWLLSLAGRLERTRQTFTYWMGCPRCGTGQDVATGLAVCGQCGLKVKTEVV